MRNINGRWYFGYFKNSRYNTVTDTVEEMKTYKNSIDRNKVIKHIETKATLWLLASTECCGIDLFTGEYFEDGDYDDGDFSFTVEFFRYYKRGDVGLPYEYEEYLKKIL